MSTYLPYNTVAGSAGSHPHTGPTTHADIETRVQIQTSESFVLVFVFYEVQCLQIAYLDLFKWLVVLYEYLCGQSKHRHVGISVGKRRGTRITMLPYDFSCWNGRRSGSTAMSQQDDNSPKKNIIKARDAKYIDVNADVVHELLRNFGNTLGAYTWNHLPTGGVSYPKPFAIMYDFVRYMLYLRWKSWTKTESLHEIAQLQTQMQCAQFALLAIVYLIKNAGLSTNNKQYHNFQALLFCRTALHPNSLWQIMCQCPEFQTVTSRHKIRLLSVATDSLTPHHSNLFKGLDNLLLSNPSVLAMFNPTLVDELCKISAWETMFLGPSCV